MSAVSPALGRPSPWRLEAGRPFVNPLFDTLLIGGGLSLAVLGGVTLARSPSLDLFLRANLWTLVLLSNSAHFAGSTVRLYTKAGSFRDLPFLTMGLPLATLLVLLLALAFPGDLGRALQVLYLTWSPYHYAAQAYGLAVMYCYRSGGEWSVADKRWLRLACLLPFAYPLLSTGLNGVLVDAMVAQPGLRAIRDVLMAILGPASLVLPVALMAWRQRSGRAPLPLISFLLVMTNAIWLVLAGWGGSLFLGLVTVFHGLQYLAILAIFHVRERTGPGGDGKPWWRHAAAFYLACLALGYALFQAWPLGFVMLGFGYAESVLLVTAVINIHHFVVDGFIWRLRRDRNYAVVQGTAVPAPA